MLYKGKTKGLWTEECKVQCSTNIENEGEMESIIL